MGSRRSRTAMQRTSWIERYEERLAFSAAPFLALPSAMVEPSGLDQFPAQTSTPASQSGDDRGSVPVLFSQHGTAAAGSYSYSFGTYPLDGSGQTIAIIDSGIAYDHRALGGGFGTEHRVVGGWDFAENDADPYDDGPFGFHGTHVAGIVASSDASRAGIAPGADIVALRVFDDHGLGGVDLVEQALQWVHQNRYSFEHPITTVNLSFGTSELTNADAAWSMLEDEIAQLVNDGIFIAAAAGNSFQLNTTIGLSYPASSPNVVAVASIDRDGSLSSFSQRVDGILAAPGRGVVSTVPDFLFGSDGNFNDFGAATGTSMATPYLAGAGMLVRQAMELVGYDEITQQVISDHLRETADALFDATTRTTYHRINIDAALEALVGNHAPPPQAHAAPTVSTDEIAYRLSQDLQLRRDGSDWYNWGGWQERWIRGRGSAWYFLTPEGTLYRWNGSRDLSTSTRIAELSTPFYADLSRFETARPSQRAAPEGTALKADTGKLKLSPHDYHNWGRWNERWLQNEQGAWFFVTPSGGLYRWQPNGRDLRDSRFIAALPANYYFDLRSLAQLTDSSAHQAGTPRNVALSADSRPQAVAQQPSDRALDGSVGRLAPVRIVLAGASESYVDAFAGARHTSRIMPSALSETSPRGDSSQPSIDAQRADAKGTDAARADNEGLRETLRFDDLIETIARNSVCDPSSAAFRHEWGQQDHLP